MSLVTFYFTSMIVSCAFVIVGLYAVSRYLSVCCKRSYSDVSVPVLFLCYVSSDDLIFSFVFALSPLSEITCTGSGSSGYD